MGYEDAKATKMLATHCCACGKPLVDAKSVETGMGPVCRKKYKYNADVPEEARKAANMHVHRLATMASDGSLESVAGSSEVISRTNELHELGFPFIAERVISRIAAIFVRCNEVDDRLLVHTPYTKSFPNFGYATRTVKGRTKAKIGKRFAWSFPLNIESKRAVFRALFTHNEGSLASGPDGAFVVARPSKAA